MAFNEKNNKVSDTETFADNHYETTSDAKQSETEITR
jgi:hypothetical protein